MFISKMLKKRYDELDIIEEESLDISAGPFLLETVLESIGQIDEASEIESISPVKNNEKQLSDEVIIINKKKVFSVLEGIIKKLEPAYREILTLMYIKNKNVEDIAIKLGIKEETVDLIAASACIELYKLLKRELVTNPYFEKYFRSGYGVEGLKALRHIT